jgi:Domain of unknown function (DUF4331)
MSHHFDTAIAREDPRLNLCDFYLFRGQSGTTVMAMTVNPNAGTKAPDTFHEEGLYAFRFDLNDDAHEEVTFKIRFGEAEHAEGGELDGRHVQTLDVRRATGRDAAEGTEGEVIASGTTGRIVAGDAGVRIFAGLAPDLFNADRTAATAYRAAVAAGQFAPDLFHGTNYFQNRNVTAIVIEVPTQLIADPSATVRAWVTVSLCGHAPEVQVSRWGLPLITHIFITDEAVKDEYNRSHPSARRAAFLSDRRGRPPALPPVGGLDRRPGRLRAACSGAPVPDHSALCPRFRGLVRFRRLQRARRDGQRGERDALAAGQHSYRPAHDCP